MPDGRKYVGEFDDGVRSGQGLMTFPDGTKYIGSWQNDKPHGQGKLSLINKYEYKGEFKNGVRHGQGTLVTVDGKRYEGQWENDVPQGQGKITYADGAGYSGQFVNGRRHGEGEATFADGRSYTGQWSDDSPNGQGTMAYKNGEQYTGEFMNGRREGKGTTVTSDGSKYLGQWQDDVLIRKEEVITDKEQEIAQEELSAAEDSMAADVAVVEEEAAIMQEADVAVVEEEAAIMQEADVIKEPVRETQTVSVDETLEIEREGFVSVKNNGVYVRTGPSSEYRITRSVNRGHPFETLDRQGDWSHVQDYLGRDGWIHNSLLENNDSVVVTASKANLRSGPGINNPVIDQIDYGKVLQIMNIDNDWYKVAALDGTVGWLSRELIWPAGQITGELQAILSPKEEAIEKVESVEQETVVESVQEVSEKESVITQIQPDEPLLEKKIEQVAIIEPPAEPAEKITVEEKIVVEMKPIEEQAVTVQQEDDKIADIIRTKAEVDQESYASVTSKGKGANIRSEPSLSAEVLRAVPTGYPLMIIERQGDWVLVEDFRQRQGWVYVSLLTDNVTVVVSVGKANLRSGPNLGDEIVAKIDYGMPMLVEEAKESWVKVMNTEGVIGWLHKDVVWP
jgi:SH3-like domain-containing protein